MSDQIKMSRRYSLKRYTPKRRKLRVVKTINPKIILLFFSFIIFSFFSIYISKKISGIKINTHFFSSNIIQSISLSVDDEKIAGSIMNIISRYKNSVFSDNIKKEIKSKIENQFPYLSDTKLNFNIVTGNLKLEAKINKSIGLLFEEGEKKYLTEDLKIVKSSYNDDSALIEISARESDITDDNARLIKQLYLNKDKIGLDFKLKIDKNNLYLISNQAIVLWGNSDFFDEKIEKIKYIIRDASSKIEPPLYIDMRFFANGKIIVSHQKTNLIKL
jgi:hypothetical protein